MASFGPLAGREPLRNLLDVPWIFPVGPQQGQRTTPGPVLNWRPRATLGVRNRSRIPVVIKATGCDEFDFEVASGGLAAK